MTLCPVAMAVGCKKCPVFAICPVKTIIGDYRPDEHRTVKKTEPARGGRRKERR